MLNPSMNGVVFPELNLGRFGPSNREKNPGDSARGMRTVIESVLWNIISCGYSVMEEISSHFEN